MPRYFGTDGVRGVAGTELTADLVFRLCRAAGLAFRPGRVLLAQDTRHSGPALAAAGCDVSPAEVLAQRGKGWLCKPCRVGTEGGA